MGAVPTAQRTLDRTGSPPRYDEEKRAAQLKAKASTETLELNAVTDPLEDPILHRDPRTPIPLLMYDFEKAVSPQRVPAAPA